MKRKRVYAFLAALSLFCSGCKSSGTDNSTENTLNFIHDNLLGVTYMENGMLYYDEYLLKYFDINTSLSTVICSDPSCKHSHPTDSKPSDCSAIMGVPSGLAYIGDKLYFAQDAERFTHKIFFTADKDGTKRKRLAEIEAERILETLYTDKHVIVAYNDVFDHSDENAVSPEPLKERPAGVYIIGLSDGKSTRISTHTGKGARIEGLSFDGANIYYLFICYNDDVGNAVLYKYNIESEQEEEISSIKELRNVVDNKCFRSTSMLYVSGDSTKKRKALHSLSFDGTDTVIAEGEVSNAFFLDDSEICYLIREGENFYYCIYNIESGETFINEKDWHTTFVEAVFEKNIYVSYPPDANASSLSKGYISKEDFINGDYDKIVPIK